MNSSIPQFKNPFRPGAGHMPPYLAGRENETHEFQRLLTQSTILENLVLTGLRGLGKTVLLETFKPIAVTEGWLWAGTDLSEAMSISDENLATRLLTDLAVATSSITITQEQAPRYLEVAPTQTRTQLSYQLFLQIYNETPGLVADKLKSVLEFAAQVISESGKRGVIFAYDEAQNLSDHARKDQYPLSLLLDSFQSIQRKNISFMLVLTGLPTLFPKLVEARTFTERMFRVVFLKALNQSQTEVAVLKPISMAKEHCPFTFKPESIQTIWEVTRGYPYFIQYVCREVFDVWVQNRRDGQDPVSIPVTDIVRKLDSDFFAGRWARATDRQRELLTVIASLDNASGEFTVQEVVEQSVETLKRPFSPSHVNQMLGSLSENGLVYKNRHGKYRFAVPLMGQFIQRQRVNMDD